MKNTRVLLAFSFLGVVWGSTWIAGSEIQGHCPPYRAAAIRYGAAAVLLLIAAGVRREQMPGRRQLQTMLTLGCTMVAAPFLLLSMAGNRISIGTTAVVFSLAPAALVLVSRGGYGPSAPERALHVALAGFAGMVLAVSGAFAFPASQFKSVTVVAIAACSVGWSLAFAKRQLQRTGSPAISAGVQLGVASMLLLVVSLVVERGQPQDWTTGSVAALASLALLGSAVGLPVLYWLLKQAQPWQVAALQWVQPLVAVAEGAALLHQRLPLTFHLGSGAVLLCVIALFWDSPHDENVLSFRAMDTENPA